MEHNKHTMPKDKSTNQSLPIGEVGGASIPPSGRLVGLELRSEKVRNIIGQVPPVLLRYGIMIIGGVLLILVGVSAFIPYQPTIPTELTVAQGETGDLYFEVVIPQDAIRKQLQFTEVVSVIASDLALPSHYRLNEISDTVTLSNKSAWHTATLIPIQPVSPQIKLQSKIVIPAKIYLRKQCVMMWVVGKIK